MTPKLVIFDVDGTLVDSQAHILAAMTAAFAARGAAPPAREAVLSIVGLSLPVAMARLAPEARPAEIDALVGAYRDSFSTTRRDAGSAQASPLYPGAAAALRRLAGRDDVLLGVATGKSRRGLAHVLGAHGLDGLFVTLQTADDHPSKPHPSMVETAMAEAGVGPEATALVGDTSFDLEMAHAAGATPIGVAWGYHPVAELRAARAHAILETFADLDAVLHTLWSRAA